MKDHSTFTCSLNIERARFLSLLNFDKRICRADGSWLQSDTGEKFLDFTSQYGAVPFGHNPAFLWDVLLQEREKMPGVMIQPFQSTAALALAQLLCEVTPGQASQVTLACSGAEAVETAIKMARSRTGRRHILATHNGFHGKTMAASLATGNPYYRAPFHCDDLTFCHVPFNDVETLEQALGSRQYAAFLVEPIQGEGGMVVPDDGYLKRCEILCRQYGTLFIVDEIQTGLGRTGHLFACEKENVQPDILLVAKALGGGLLPISACIAQPTAWSQAFGQRHSSTFANNHLAASIGIAVIRKLVDEPAVLQNVRDTGMYLKAELAALVSTFPHVFRAHSGEGFMQGLTLCDWHDDEAYVTGLASEQGYVVPLVASYLLNRHGVLTAPTLNACCVLRIQPNYLTTRAQIDRLMAGLHDVGQLITAGHFAAIFRAAMGLSPDSRSDERRALRHARATPPEQKGKKLGTFAFFIHPPTENDAIEGMPGGVGAFSESEQQQVRGWMNTLKTVNGLAAPCFHIPCVPSKTGGYVDGWLISSPLTPADMLHLEREEKHRLLASYVESAKRINANVIGLGAFTSVISRGGLLVSDCGIPVTTGNAYTALTSTDSLRQLCQRIGRRLDQSHLGIVGVSGSVGRLALLDLAPDCRKVTLIGNARHQGNHEHLEAVAGELLLALFQQADRFHSPLLAKLKAAGIHAEEVKLTSLAESRSSQLRKLFHRIKYRYELSAGSGDDFPLVLTNDIARHLPDCDIVITATSNGEAFIQPDHLAQNAIVCDVARPSDLTHSVVMQRPDVMAYDGGLVNLPTHMRFGGPNIVGLETGVSLACLSETIVLTMAGAKHHYSLGGVSSIAEARHVFQLAQQHGFTTHLPSHLFDKHYHRALHAMT